MENATEYSVFMDTTNPEIINELFVRLNSGVPVNAAEKRNANGGILSTKIQELCDTSSFFTRKIRVANRRLAHNDLVQIAAYYGRFCGAKRPQCEAERPGFLLI